MGGEDKKDDLEATTLIPDKMPCYQCSQLHDDRKSLRSHLQLCKGKFQGCKGLGVYNSQTFRVDKKNIL